jgi:hypothetical protein
MSICRAAALAAGSNQAVTLLHPQVSSLASLLAVAATAAAATVRLFVMSAPFILLPLSSELSPNMLLLSLQLLPLLCCLFALRCALQLVPLPRIKLMPFAIYQTLPLTHQRSSSATSIKQWWGLPFEPVHKQVAAAYLSGTTAPNLSQQAEPVAAYSSHTRAATT